MYRSADMSSAVERQKSMLTRSETLKYSVDWLTEVTFRLTDAWLKQRDFPTVSMRSPMRLQKVCHKLNSSARQ